MVNPKVVQLSAVREAAGRTSGSKIPLPMILLRDRVTETLRGALQTLMDRADDALFELADKAATNADQTRFFDAMRILRLNRQAIEGRFFQAFNQGFRLEGVQRGASALREKALDMDSLSLVDNDQLELNVAVESMASRLKADAGQSLDHLLIRLDALVTDQSVDDDNNPLGPLALARHFAQALESCEWDIRVRLVLLKLFERHVLKIMPDVYKDANAFLVAQGVLPDLRTGRTGGRMPPVSRGAPVRRTVDQQTGQVEVSGAEDMASGPEDTFALLRQLMGQARGQTATPQAGVIPPQNVVAALTGFQMQAVPVAQADTGLLDYQALVQHMIQQVSRGKGRLGQVDEDVINLVSMLFEYILSDHQLENAIKAQIARLQIPVLKAALLDRSFFSSADHSARRLLNELANSAIGWQPREAGQRDPYFEKVTAIVERLVNEFDRDLGLFDDVLEDFLAFLTSEEKRRRLLEKRTCDAEQGRAQTDIAREQVRRAILARLEGSTCDEGIRDLLLGGWAQKAVLDWLRHGPESEAYAATLKTVDDVLWSVAPPLVEGSRRELLTRIPGLIRTLREGLKEAAVEPGNQEIWLKALEKAHLKALHALATVSTRQVVSEAPAPTPDPAAEQGQPEAEVPADVRMAASGKEGVPVAGHDHAADPAATRDDRTIRESREAELDEAIEEIVLTAPGEAPEAPAYQGTDDEYLQKVDALKVGSWIELRESEDRKQRCKLAAIISNADKYIFVNRMGVKVCEKTRMGLAVAMRAGQVNILDDGLLFDRALEAVIGSLRSNSQRA
ncbi:DUF1631 domain-containing protein [Hahella sp. SMD15-11]|uniref:DUF1631 domain-containing protein n=1 Tax=Thermohahella caldifontis TaxID=3142973 RepID=A0AB39UZD7_9GAMM